MKVSNEKHLSVFSIVKVVLLLSLTSIFSYMFIQPSVTGGLNDSPTIDQTAHENNIIENRNDNQVYTYTPPIDRQVDERSPFPDIDVEQDLCKVDVKLSGDSAGANIRSLCK